MGGEWRGEHCASLFPSLASRPCVHGLGDLRIPVVLADAAAADEVGHHPETADRGALFRATDASQPPIADSRSAPHLVEPAGNYAERIRRPSPGSR